LLIIILFVFGIYSLGNGGSRVNSPDLNITISEEDLRIIPKGSVHWHPRLRILIDGQQINIPANIGISIGRLTDLHLGMKRSMSPTHTHDNSGTIHLENLNPSAKPVTMTLGYFFYVWGKTFNKSCIFEYCTDKGTLRVFVNGREIDKFEGYVMRDGDDILIEYRSEK
jgi:hypothetical protein